MKVTNLAGLPEPIVRAVMNDPYDYNPNTISATQLAGPPRIRVLTKRHYDEIEEDAADRIWALLGSSTHAMLERAGVEDALQEQRLSMEINGATITGKPDLYSKGVLTDFKVTSVWTVQDGKFRDEWEEQLNIYCVLLRAQGLPVTRLQVIAILRDWQRSKAMDEGYPPVSVVERDIPMWSPGMAVDYLLERVSLHRAADDLGDTDLPLCTQEERWEKASKWALMKPGRKSALKVFPTEGEAKAALELATKDCYVEERLQEPTRCKSYCSVAPWCTFYAEYMARRALEEEG